MHIEFIDITTYRGISSEAEHFYAKVSRPNYNADMVALDIGTNFQTCSGDIGGEALRFFPTREQAEKYAEKDYPAALKYTIGEEEMNRRRRWLVEELLENGTIRFPSAIEVIKGARKKFPDAVLYFTFCGSHKEFLKRFCFDRETSKVNPEIERLLIPEDDDNKPGNNDLSDFEYGMLRYLQEAANQKSDEDIVKVTKEHSQKLLELAKQ